jgi:hypothetical protein
VFDDANQPLSESYSGGPLNGLSVTNGYVVVSGNAYLQRGVLALNTTVPSAANLLTVDYACDVTGRLTWITDASPDEQGANATYDYVANSDLVSQFQRGFSGMTRTTNYYDNLNRLTNTGTGTDWYGYGYDVASEGCAYNAANQRIGMTNLDASYWSYGYDALGQVTNGNKNWGDGTIALGQQFGYAFDEIGNRTGTSGLSNATYGANLLNQLASQARHESVAPRETFASRNVVTNRTVPGVVNVMGSATNAATASVNNHRAYRHGNYYQWPLAVTNTVRADNGPWQF